MRRLLLPAALAAAVAAGCNGESRRPAPLPEATAAPVFEEVTAAAGIDFRHENGAEGKRWLPETMGSGCAIADFDLDGRQDLVLVDSTPWPGSRRPPGQCRFYRNRGNWRFEDLSRQWNMPAGIFGMGAAAADYDGDGRIDLLITALGGSRLLRNESRGGFRDVTREVGLHTPGWPTSAAWVDYNRDGWVDLFVCHYVRWSPERDLFFSLDGVHKTYARPNDYAPEPCQLFENRRGRFVDVSHRAGVDLPNSKALGVALCDFDRDGWVDLAVSNDTVPNFLFHNQGNGTFKEVAVQAGVAVAEAGFAKAGMGIDAADLLNDGREALLITNFAGEQISLYHREPTGLFMDVAARAGLGIPSQRHLGFGCFFFDADLDGWLDVLVANGHIQPDIAVRTSAIRYAQPALLFRGSPRGRFTDLSARAGALAVPRVARGAAFGDLDGDGDLDVLLTTNGGPPALLRQAGRPASRWVRFWLQGEAPNTTAIGATVRLRSGGRLQTRMVRSGSSYLSQSSPAVTFGLGPAGEVDEVEVRWPDGSVEGFGRPVWGREHGLVQGNGE